MFILASKSPRRQDLLKEIIAEFEICPAEIDEYLYPFEELSLAKAKAISQVHQDDIIISADTLVLKGDKVFGKPKNHDEAKRILQELSNDVHEVKTIYSIYSKNQNIEKTRIVTSKVYFNDLSLDLIEKYIATGSPFDKAGGYGIQDKEFNLVNHIEGSYTNIVGLPIDELKEDLELLHLI